MVYLNTTKAVEEGDLVWQVPYVYFDRYNSCWTDGEVGIVRSTEEGYIYEHGIPEWFDTGELNYVTLISGELVYKHNENFLLSPISELDEVPKDMTLFHVDKDIHGNVYYFNIVKTTDTVSLKDTVTVPTEQNNLIHGKFKDFPVNELYYIAGNSEPNKYYKGKWKVEALKGDIVEYNHEEATILEVYKHHDRALIKQGDANSVVAISELQFVKPRDIEKKDLVIIGVYDTTIDGEVVPSYNTVPTGTPIYKVVKILEKGCYILKDRKTNSEMIGQSEALTLLQPREVCSPNEASLDLV